MNSFAHALPFLDRPLVAIGASLPDWLAAADRKCRLREKRATPLIDDENSTLAELAQGVVQHHRDDYWFHTSAAFRDYEMKLAIEIREIYGTEHGMRSGFVAHVMVEMFLDSFLQKKFTGQLERYYEIVDAADAPAIQETINQFATRPTTKLVPAMARFVSERFIFDYLTDQGAVKRMNGVLKRIGLEPLDDKILPWAATARERVYGRVDELLCGYALDVGQSN
jgi:hypothetical protein